MLNYSRRGDSYQETFGNKLQFLRKEALPVEKAEEKEREGVSIFQGLDKQTYLNRIEKAGKNVEKAQKAFLLTCEICEEVKKAGGRALIVGGAVRDEILGLSPKDFDVEIYGLDPQVVEKIASGFGSVKDVGKAFGILKINEGGVDVDVSLPRTDSKVGVGHRGFEVKVDTNMSVKDAARRRDFTFNALSKDPLTGEIFDPFGGVEDLRTRTLRITDPERFKDDPLRLLRAAQFVGRFGLGIEQDSLKIMKEMVPDLKEISVDRVREEWEKLLLRSFLPSMGLNALDQIGIVDKMYPELSALKGVQQDKEWHPEGDVWIHELKSVDAAKRVVADANLPESEARIIMLATLCHDFGKPMTTEFKDGHIRSHAHDVEGVKPAEAFLERIGTRKDDIEKIKKLIKEHVWITMTYLTYSKGIEKGQTITAGAFRRLAKRLHPATLEELLALSEADGRGVGPFLDPNKPGQYLLPFVDRIVFKAVPWARRLANELGIYKEKPPTLIRGRDLLALGFNPNISRELSFGVLIKLADDCRDQLGLGRDKIMAALETCGGDIAQAKEKLQNFFTQQNH